MASFSNFKSTITLSASVKSDINIGLDSATSSSIAKSVVSGNTLTKTFTQNEEYTLTLADPIEISPLVSATKEVAPSDVSSKGNWDVNSTASNYDLHNTAYDTTLQKTTSTNVVPISSAYTNSNLQDYDVVYGNVYVNGKTQPNFQYVNDGQYLLVSSYNSQAQLYSLSAPYDPSTASLISTSPTFSYTQTGANHTWVARISGDGTKVYAGTQNSGRIYQFTLGTAWDLTSMSFPADTFIDPQSAGSNIKDLGFDPTGTILYVISDQTTFVQYTPLGTAWDLTTFTNTATTSMTLSANPTSFDFSPDGTKLLVIHNNNSSLSIYELPTPFSLTNSYTSVTSSSVGSFANTYRWQCAKFNGDGTKIQATIYNSSNIEYFVGYPAGGGTPTNIILAETTSRDLSVAAEYIFNPTGSGTYAYTFNNDGTIFYLDDYSTDRIYQYQLSTAYDLSTAVNNNEYFDYSSYGATGRLLEFNPTGTRMITLIQGVNNNYDLHQFTLTTAWDIRTATYDNISVATNGFRYGVSVEFNGDGSKGYILSNSTDDISVFDLSTPYDFSTKTYSYRKRTIYLDSSFTGDSSPKKISFSSDGTSLYVLGSASDTVYQYNLTTPYDLRTSSYSSQSFAVGTQEATPDGMDFSADGTKMYIIGSSSDSVQQYTLSTAWDVTTASFTQSFSVAAQTTGPYDVKFSADGTKMFVNRNQEIYYYTLSTAWDISTATYDSAPLNGFSLAFGIKFNNNGTKFYVADYSPSIVYQYSLTTAYDLSTATQDLAYSTYVPNFTPNNYMMYDSGTKIALWSAGTNIYELTLTTGWDLSTIDNLEDGTTLLDIDLLGNSIYGMKFNEDGTELYTAGYGTKLISQYTLSTPYDFSTATFVTSRFVGLLTDPYSSTVAPWVIGYANNNIYWQNNSGHNIYQLSLNGTVNSFSSADVGKRIVAGGGEATIISSAGEYVENTTIPDVTYTSGQWEMYALNVDATNGISSIVTNYNPDAWDISAASYVQSFYINAQELTIQDVQFKTDGTKMYIVGSSGDEVNEYDLSTAWDISSASFLQTFSVSSTAGATPIGLYFRSLGDIMYVSSTTGVFQYSLSTPWDISTASYVQTYNPSLTGMYGLFFKPDGLKMYISDQDADAVLEYDLSTAWDISTASLLQSFSVLSTSPVNRGLYFKPDGSKFYVVEVNADTVEEYNLSTAWNISTASYSQNYDMSALADTSSGVTFKPDGSKMYVPGYAGDDVHEFSIGTTTVLTPNNYSSAITNNSGQINITNWADINSMTADDNVPGSSEVYYAVSTDNKNSFNIVNSTLGERTIVRMKDSGDSAWQYNSNSTYALSSWTDASVDNVFIALNEAIENNSTNRMAATQLSNATDANHFNIDSSTTLDLAIIMKSDGTNNPTSDGVSINYTGALYNKNAKLDSDYTYIHDDDTNITITALVAGNYKFRVI